MCDQGGDQQDRIQELEVEVAGLKEALQQQEVMTAILEGTPDFVSTSTPDGKILHVNTAGLKMVGLDPGADPRGMNIADFHSEEVVKRVLETAVPRAIEGGVYQHETELLHRDGHVIPVSQVILAHRGPDGELSYLSTVIRDISLSRVAEHSFRSILQASPMGMHRYRMEEDGRLIFIGANPAADRMLGVDNDQFVGLTIEEAFPPLVETEIPARYRQAAGEGVAWQTSQVIYEDNQIQGAYEVYAFQTSSGHMVATFLDITARKRNEQERERLEEQLRQAQKMEAIGQLAGGVAHDFNNLLTGISGYADMILEEVGEGAAISPDLEEILKAAERATDLTRQLLAFSRKQIIAPKVIDTNEVLARSQRMLGRIIGEDVRLTVALGHALWPIKADPGQLHQILVNLATNARDAMPEGGTLQFETRNTAVDVGFAKMHAGLEPADYVLIAISDTGEGMEQELCERIFEPFFTTKEPGRGTGLGLSTVYGIVKQNSGHISVYSERGMGTTFKIYLPRCQEAPTGPEDSAANVTPVGDETVLLVEDEEIVRGLTERMLGRWGYRVLTAGAPQEATRVCAEHDGVIHLLLTDVVMPQTNGKVLYEALVLDRPDLKVLFMSGYTDDVIAHHGVLEEGTPFLSKPFTSNDLALKVRSVLDDT
jgi:two-component system cell cycle sensor histidine kinase/response regulator CckA